MVNSLINPDINYEKNDFGDDIDHSSSVYEMDILGKNVEVVLGRKRETGGVAYFVAYVVLKSSKVRPIGVFEEEPGKLSGLLDEDGDIDLDRTNSMLMFENIDLSDSLVPSDTEDMDETAEPIEKDKTAEPIEKDKTAEIEDASRTTEESEKELVTTGPWIKQFMQNKNYSLLDNEGGGDCLFAAIRDAFQHIGKEYTVGDLRKLLGNEVTQETYENYRSLYDSFNTSIKETKAELNEIAKENNKLKEELSNEERTSKQVSIVERAKKLKEKFMRLKEELAVSKQMLNEQGFMANVNSLDQFRAKINTCKFWGDTWAISTLERVLNTKLVLFSEENFLDGDEENVLQCGQLNDAILEENGMFTPDHYIMLDYNGYHYKLITYKNNGIFTFKQLPFAVRDLIADKCLEKMSGPYAIIPEFAGIETETDDREKVNKEIESLHRIGPDPETVFMFYGRSSGKPLPGKGSGEKIPSSRRAFYKKLAEFKDWRQKLSNEWVSPFDMDGHQWQSVEHYHQGSRYKNSNPDLYYQFSLDSRSELGRSVEQAKKFKGPEPDMEFFGKHGRELLSRAIEAKFTQNKEMRDILISTHDATLTEYKPRKPAQLSLDLMIVRKNLTK